jgi:hypothetical protein
MCVVIDMNTLAPVFNEGCVQHADFRPIKEWIERGHGVLVFGGTRYKEELSKAYRYLRLIRQMKISGHAVSIQDDAVDEAEIRVIAQTTGTDCDDQHIIALLGVSGCPLFCSNDGRSFRYIRDKRLFPAKKSRVRIYSSVRNQALLRPMRREMLKKQE